MNVAGRRPGSSTTFLDASSEEAILQFAADGEGVSFMAYHLYDAGGSFVADSSLEQFPEGIEVRCGGGEVLLAVPSDPEASLHYRLYNSRGDLLTSSDGVRTMIYPQLRMEGVSRDWAPPWAERPATLRFRGRRGSNGGAS
jgi:hypothetical protein